MRAYLDASVVLRLLLEDGPALREFSSLSSAVASELTELECLRTVDRLRANGRLSEPQAAEAREQVFRILRHVDSVAVSTAILRRAAAPFPTPLGTLDAIHLATALMIRDSESSDLHLATHDQALALAARSMGLAVIGA